VLSEPLCFLVNRFVKGHLKTLKTSAIDFFNRQEILEAKFQLLDDLERVGVPITAKHPRVPKYRRGKENTAVRNLEDIISVFIYLDENKLLDQLPRYVSANPEASPSTRLCEGDLKFLFAYLDKIDNAIQGFGVQLSAVMQQVHALQWTQTRPVQIVNTQPPRDPVFGPSQSQQSSYAAAAANATTTETRPTRPPTGAGTGAKPKQTFGQPSRVSDVNTPRFSESGKTPTVKSRSAQPDWAHLSSHGESTDDDESFTTYVSRYQQRKKRKLENRSREQENEREANLERSPAPASRRRSRWQRAPLVVGKVTAGSVTSAASNVDAFVAAKPYVKKKIFSIDNVNPAFTVEQLTKFVSDLDVAVLSCYKVDPRRRRKETKEQAKKDRSAFRLCIKTEDQDKLINADRWPEYVIVSDWYFAPSKERKETDAEDGEPRRHDTATDEDKHSDEEVVMDETMNAVEGATGGATGGTY